MKCVLTGGTGVLGRAAVASLLEAGHEVQVVCRSTQNVTCVEQRGAVAVRGDLADRESLVRAFEGADAVVNLATHVPVGRRAALPGAWRQHDRLRTEGARALVDAAREAGVRRLVQESVSFLYADQGDDWVTERSPLDINATTEPAAVAESAVQDWADGLRTGVVLRLGQVVGDDAQTQHLLRAARRGRPVGVGHPSDWAHVLHTDDLGGAVVAALHAPSGVYNVGAEPVRRLDLAQGYADAAGVELAGFRGVVGRKVMGARLEPLERSLRVCSDHFAAQTGWRPRRPKFESSWLEAALDPAGQLHDAAR